MATPSLPEQQEDLAKTLARGSKVYATSCQPCHGDRYGRGSIGRAHPHNEKGHTWHHPDAQLKEWIIHGKPGPGFSVMPGFTYLTEDDVEAVLAFIKTWWTAEQREIQADISRRYDQAINSKKKDLQLALYGEAIAFRINFNVEYPGRCSPFSSKPTS